MKYLINITLALLIINNVMAQNSFCLEALPDAVKEYSGAKTAIATADLNDDGYKDLITGGFPSDGSVSVIMNNGNGTFATHVAYSSGVKVIGVATGDFNNDGAIDFVAANQQSYDVSVFINNGAGTFSLAATYYAGTSPMSICVADFNADNLMDIAVTGSTKFCVLINTGTGTFGSPTIYTQGLNTLSIAAGDINQDGHSDLIVSIYDLYTSPVKVFLNDGTGLFGSAVTYYSSSIASTVTTGDLNSDGKTDVATANSGGQVSVFMNNGTGTLVAPVNYTVGTSPSSLIIGNMDGDSYPDIVVSNQTSGSVSVLINQGSGIFSTAKNSVLPYNSQPKSVTIGDFDRDSKMDIAVADYYLLKAIVLINDGKGTFCAAKEYVACTEPFVSAWGDLNNDGYQDLVVASDNSSQNIAIMINTGSGTFFPATVLSVATIPNELEIKDLNLDGKNDIVVGSSYGLSAVTVFMNTGNAVFASPVNYNISGYSDGVAAGDLNGDLYPDIVATNHVGGGVDVLLNNGNGTFGASTPYTVIITSPISVDIADINGDGNNDVVFVGDGGVVVMINSGSGTLGTPVIYNAMVYSNSVKIADVNMDGHPDIVEGIITQNKVGVLINSGSGTFGAPMYYNTGNSPYEVEIGDINNDGKPDIITPNFDASNHSNPSTFSVLINNGSGSFLSAYNQTVGIHPHSASVCDFNNDGVSDIAVTHYPYLSLTENNVWILLGFKAAITDTCIGNSLVLYATHGGTSYLWSPSGSSADSLVVSSTGTYSVTVTSPESNCTSSASFIVTSPCITSVYETQNENLIQVYPNPSDGVINIQTDEMVTLEIYNTLGTLIYSKNLMEGTHEIKLNVSSGVYLVKTRGNLKTQTGRIIIK